MRPANLYEAERMIADAILHASGTYISPVFGELNKPLFNGDYYSYRSFTSAGRYASSQVWFGSNGVIMEGDPIVVEGRNDLTGGSGNDVLYGAPGTTTFIYGLDGNDTIIGPEDLMASGGDGDDFIIGGLTVNARGSGNYLIEWQKKLANASDLSADELHKLFNYTDGECTMYGGAGNDTLVALNNQNHELYGDDTMVNSGTGNDLIVAGDGDNLVYGGGGDDRIFLGDGQNTVYGGSGNDYIEVGDNYLSQIDAGSGNDTIVLAGDIESLDGGEGNDFVSFENSTKGLDIYLDNLFNVEAVGGTFYDDTMIGTSHNDYFDGLYGNDLLRGGLGNDTIFGNAGNDIIYGDTGNDVLYGGVGDDDLYGGVGNDNMYGGIGSDFYFLEKDFGFDQVFEYANQGTDDRIIFQYLTMSDVIYGRSGNDLMFGNSDQSNVVAIVDWFENFGIDSFWFTTGTANQYNYVTAAQIAELFGVEIPVDTAASSEFAMASSNDLSASQEAITSTYELLDGTTLTDLAIEVTGLDQAPIDMVPAC